MMPNPDVDTTGAADHPNVTHIFVITLDGGEKTVDITFLTAFPLAQEMDTKFWEWNGYTLTKGNHASPFLMRWMVAKDKIIAVTRRELIPEEMAEIVWTA